MAYKLVYKLFFLLFPLLLIATPGDFGPWGQDASLYDNPCHQETRLPSLPLKIFSLLINFHHKVISPVDGPRSHYRPSSSRYMLLAMKKHGVVKGFFLGCDRLIRENNDPWVYRTVVIDGKKYKQDLP
jgi:uncharacterized protein